MKNRSYVLILFVLLVSTLGCGLVGKLVDKGTGLTRAASLWSDVPRMDGLTDSTGDMPTALKLVARTFVDMVLNSDKDSKQHVSTDWIVFSYKGSESDIKKFYTPDQMKSGGNWLPPQGMSNPCMDGKEQGLYGDVCLYQKQVNGKQQGIVIIALPTKEPDRPVFVYFLRAEATPEK